MTDQVSTPTTNYVELAADIVSAFVSNNSVPTADLPALIASVHGALQNVAHPVQAKTEEKQTPGCAREEVGDAGRDHQLNRWQILQVPEAAPDSPWSQPG